MPGERYTSHDLVKEKAKSPDISSEVKSIVSLDYMYRYLDFLVSSSVLEDKKKIKNELAAFCWEVENFLNSILFPLLESLTADKKTSEVISDVDEVDEWDDEAKQMIDIRQRLSKVYSKWNKQSLKKLLSELKYFKLKIGDAMKQDFSKDSQFVSEYLSNQNFELKRLEDLKREIDVVFSLESIQIPKSKKEAESFLSERFEILSKKLGETEVGLISAYPKYVEHIKSKMQQIKGALWAIS